LVVDLLVCYTIDKDLELLSVDLLYFTFGILVVTDSNFDFIATSDWDGTNLFCVNIHLIVFISHTLYFFLSSGDRVALMMTRRWSDGAVKCLKRALRRELETTIKQLAFIQI
jgi:hypothetical protein